MSNSIYKKEKGKYVPVAPGEWNGFPCDGLWLVQYKPNLKSSECVIKVDELDSIKPAAGMILEYKDKIINFLKQEMEEGNLHLYNISLGDFSSKLLKEINK